MFTIHHILKSKQMVRYDSCDNIEIQHIYISAHLQSVKFTQSLSASQEVMSHHLLPFWPCNTVFHNEKVSYVMYIISIVGHIGSLIQILKLLGIVKVALSTEASKLSMLHIWAISMSHLPDILLLNVLALALFLLFYISLVSHSQNVLMFHLVTSPSLS